MTTTDVNNLERLRDQLVEERRAFVDAMLADPQATGESAAEFEGIQQFIDAVERALSHEALLNRPAPALNLGYARRRPG